jgi:hypothetical protein
MMKYTLKSVLLSFCYVAVLFKHADSACFNNFDGRVVTAAGDWSTFQWSATDPFSTMTFDEVNCKYYLVLTGLDSEAEYNWKVDRNFQKFN